MDKKQRKLRICAALLILNITVIWGNSLLPGSISGAISGWVRDLLASIFPSDTPEPDAGHGLLRKLAHFTEFSFLGALLTWLFVLVQKPKALALPCGFLVASVDETIQRFVPERGPSFKDVLIDTAGVTTGILLLLGGCAILKCWRTRNSENLDCIASCDDNGSACGSLPKEACGANGDDGQNGANGPDRGENPADRQYGRECQ